MLPLLLSDKFCCFGIFVFVFKVLVLVNEFVIFSFFTIFIFVKENHTARNCDSIRRWSLKWRSARGWGWERHRTYGNPAGVDGNVAGLVGMEQISHDSRGMEQNCMQILWECHSIWLLLFTYSNNKLFSESCRMCDLIFLIWSELFSIVS